MRLFLRIALAFLVGVLSLAAQEPNPANPNTPGFTINSFDTQYIYYNDNQGNLHRTAVTPIQSLGTPTGVCVGTETDVNVLNNFFYYCLKGTWTLISGGGGGGGSPAGNVNSIQLNAGNSLFGQSAASDNGSLFSIAENTSITGTANVTGATTIGGLTTINAAEILNGDSQNKGPNPWVDIRAYGARSACNGNTSPCAPGITATMGANTTATVSQNWPGVNGDGVVVFGAGPVNTLTTPGAPTVTPSIAAAGTRTGLVVNSPAGATTYNYQVLARDAAGGFTPAGSVGSTSTGETLGAQSVAISGFTRSGNIVTATTSSPHGLATGAMVYITTTNGFTDNLYFGGWFVVSDSADNTHFTYVTGNDVADGALATSSGGGTAHWFNCNHLTWTPVTGAFAYYIYGRTGGSLTLIGVSTPQTTVTDAEWDDFGSPMMDGFVAPYFIPTTPSGSGSSDPLVTTIVSGAGSTTLTLANAATTAVTNATILFDNTPNIQTAASHATNGSLLYFPQTTNGFVVNSYLTIPANVSIALAGGGPVLNDTMQISSGDKIFGMLGAQSQSNQAFSWPVGGFITVNKANFGLFGISGGGLHIDGIQLTGTSNGQYLMVADSASGSQSHWHNVNFVDGGGSGDYMGVNLLVRGSFWNDLDHIAFDTGPGQEGGGFNGTTATPSAIFDTGGLNLSNLSVQDRGLFHIPGSAGAHVTLTGISRDQGGITPFLMSGFYSGGIVGGSIYMSGVELDTMSHAYFASLSNNTSAENVVLTFENMGSGPSGAFGGITGKPVLLVLGSNGNGTNYASVNAYNFTNNAVNVTGIGEFEVPISVAGAPGLAASNGGNVPIGGSSYAVTFVDVNGQESTLSAFTNITVSSPNQTVTVTPPAAPLGAVAWKPYRGHLNGLDMELANIPGCQNGSLTFSQTFVDTFSFLCANSPPSINRAGAQSISAAGISGTKINLLGGGFSDAITGTFTAARTQTLPDVSGTIGVLTGAFTATHCLQVAGSGTTLSVIDSGGTCGGGGGGATFQVNGVNTSNQVTINFENSAAFNGLTATFSNPSLGNVQLGFSGTLGNAGLTNSSVTVNTSSPLGGGGAVSLGGSLTLTCATCSTAVVNPGTANHIAEYTASGSPATVSSDASLDDGATAPSTLTYTGSGGVSTPKFTATGVGAGTITATEGSSPSGVALSDIFWASSVVHRWEMNNNNGGTLVVAANPMTAAGDIVYGGTVTLGVATETRLGAGTATQVLHSGTTPSWSAVALTTDVSGLLPVANGGCAASTAANCLINIFPTATRAGDVIYWNGTAWTNLAGNNSGTACFQENASGVPTFGSCGGGSGALSGLTAAIASNTIANGNNPQVWNWTQTTASQSAFTFGETTAATGSGDIELNIQTLNTSTALPIQITAQGTANGWNMSTAGLWRPIGTGALANGGTAHGFSISEGATTAVASLVCASNTVPLGAGSSADPTCGTVPNAALTNSSVTFNTVAVALGASGNISLDLITNPAASKTFTFPASGVLTISGTAPNSSGGAGTNAGTLFGVTAVAGGATTGSATTAGNGSAISIIAGAGGSGSGGTNAIGGAGGGFTFTAGAGGASSGTAVNSNGGGFAFTTGAAGTGGSGTAGSAGTFTINGNQAVTSTGNATAAKQIPVSSGANSIVSFIDFPQMVYAPAADCVNGTPGSGWSTGATPASLCRAGTNNKDALLSPWGASDVGYFKVHLPNDWDSGASLDISIDLTSTDATNGHTIIMQASTVCAKGDGSTTDDVAFNAAQSFGTITLNGNANRTWNATLTGLTKTGCAAGSTLWVKISRTTDTATNVGVYGATIDIARLLTVQAN